MIARSWSARATGEGAKAYVAFFDGTLRPVLEQIEGHEGALVLTRALGGDSVEIRVLTFWRSAEAIARFAGDEPGRAVVEPEARALLASFDEDVTHQEVALDTRRPARPGA